MFYLKVSFKGSEKVIPNNYNIILQANFIAVVTDCILSST